MSYLVKFKSVNTLHISSNFRGSYPFPKKFDKSKVCQIVFGKDTQLINLDLHEHNISWWVIKPPKKFWITFKECNVEKCFFNIPINFDITLVFKCSFLKAKSILESLKDSIEPLGYITLQFLFTDNPYVHELKILEDYIHATLKGETKILYRMTVSVPKYYQKIDGYYKVDESPDGRLDFFQISQFSKNTDFRFHYNYPIIFYDNQLLTNDGKIKEINEDEINSIESGNCTTFNFENF